MKAVIAEGPGGPEVLKVADVETPEPSKGEILVCVKACGLNPVDYKIRQGYLSSDKKYPAIYGFDVSGIVEKAGSGVTGFSPGDEVFYYADLDKQGAYAEYHTARAEIVRKKPEGLTHVEAASLPLAGTTAWQGLFKQARLAFGETVVIVGAAGGVGSMAAQMTAWSGANVIAVCSSSNTEYVKKLGANHVVDYTKQDIAKAVLDITKGKGADMALDTVGGDVFFETFKFLRPFGRVVFLNAFTAQTPMTSLNPARLKNISILCEFIHPSVESLDFIATLAERGFLKPQVETVIPMDKIAHGHRRLETRRGWGKIVVDMSL
ncbi:MAG: NADP-dependent oxidoreductase [Nitrospinae bacterium]|nr:NADP-dependent oxidoreductase [Nitrospinota bacterium]